jgi:hypothetical protein
VKGNAQFYRVAVMVEWRLTTADLQKGVYSNAGVEDFPAP